MLKRLGLVALIVCVVVAGESRASGLGSEIQPFSLADQNGNYARVDESVRVIILTRDMAAGDVMKSALSINGKSLLASHRAVYITDVSAMPGFVRNLLMLPKLKDRPYPMLLDTDGAVSAKLPSKESHATLIFLDKLKITAVEYLTRPDTVATALEAPKRFSAVR